MHQISIFALKCSFGQMTPIMTAAAVIITAGYRAGVLVLTKQARMSSLGSLDPMALLSRDISGRQQLCGISLKRTGQNNQLYDINPALPAFNTRDKRLMTLQSASQLGLRETRRLAGICQCLAQRFVPLTSDCLCHADANPLSHQR